jgi:hypothetical protein
MGENRRFALYFLLAFGGLKNTNLESEWLQKPRIAQKKNKRFIDR